MRLCTMCLNGSVVVVDLCKGDSVRVVPVLDNVESVSSRLVSDRATSVALCCFEEGISHPILDRELNH